MNYNKFPRPDKNKIYVCILRKQNFNKNFNEYVCVDDTVMFVDSYLRITFAGTDSIYKLYNLTQNKTHEISMCHLHNDDVVKILSNSSQNWKIFFKEIEDSV